MRIIFPCHQGLYYICAICPKRWIRVHTQTQCSLGPCLHIRSVLAALKNGFSPRAPHTHCHLPARAERGNFNDDIIWWSSNTLGKKVDLHAHIPGNIPAGFRMKTPMVIVVKTVWMSRISPVQHCCWSTAALCCFHMLNERRLKTIKKNIIPFSWIMTSRKLILGDRKFCFEKRTWLLWFSF